MPNSYDEALARTIKGKGNWQENEEAVESAFSTGVQNFDSVQRRKDDAAAYRESHAPHQRPTRAKLEPLKKALPPDPAKPKPSAEKASAPSVKEEKVQKSLTDIFRESMAKSGFPVTPVVEIDPLAQLKKENEDLKTRFKEGVEELDKESLSLKLENDDLKRQLRVMKSLIGLKRPDQQQ